MVVFSLVGVVSLGLHYALLLWNVVCFGRFRCVDVDAFGFREPVIDVSLAGLQVVLLRLEVHPVLSAFLAVNASWNDVLLWLKRLVWEIVFVDAYLSDTMDFR